jgi:hypothetical protein
MVKGPVVVGLDEAVVKLATRPFADVLERFCWRAAGATAAVCLALVLLHRPAPEPDVSALLLDWPAETGDLF